MTEYLSDLLKNPDPETRERQVKAFDKMLEEKKAEIARLTPLRKVLVNTNLSAEDARNCQWAKLKIIPDVNAGTWNLIRKWTPEKNWGLFIYGSVGTGKTHMLKGLMVHWALKADVKSCFYSLQDLSSAFRRAAFDNDKASASSFKAKLNDNTIIVIDDFGAENTSDFVQSELLSFIDKRIAKNKVVFISSNLSPEELKNVYDERILDRLQALMHFTECDGPSYRRVIAQERLEKEKF